MMKGEEILNVRQMDDGISNFKNIIKIILWHFVNRAAFSLIEDNKNFKY